MKSRPNLVDTFRDSIIFRLICFIIVLTAFSGFLIHRLEPFHFTTWFDGICGQSLPFYSWIWRLCSPYDDRKTNRYKYYFIRTGFCSYYMVLFATEMINKQYMKIKGEEAATSNGHMIIVGWNERKTCCKANARITTKP